MADWSRKLVPSDVSVRSIYNIFLPWHRYKKFRQISIQLVNYLNDFLTLMVVKREKNYFGDADSRRYYSFQYV